MPLMRRVSAWNSGCRGAAAADVDIEPGDSESKANAGRLGGHGRCVRPPPLKPTRGPVLAAWPGPATCQCARFLRPLPGAPDRRFGPSRCKRGYL